MRASDVYLVRKEESWELGGVDVGLNAFLRRLLPKARRCPPPHKAIDWVHLQTFVPPTSHEGPDPSTRTAAAGAVGGGLQLGTPAKDIQRLRAKEVASILSDLGRREGAQVASLVAPATAAAGAATPPCPRTRCPARGDQRAGPRPAAGAAGRARTAVTSSAPPVPPPAPTHSRRRWVVRLLAVLAILGPGLIAANAGNDAGGILTYASAGSQFGYRTLFLMVLITVALVVVQEMCSRLGVFTGRGSRRPHPRAVLRPQHLRGDGPAADRQRRADRQRVRRRRGRDGDLRRVPVHLDPDRRRRGLGD